MSVLKPPPVKNGISHPLLKVYIFPALISKGRTMSMICDIMAIFTWILDFKFLRTVCTVKQETSCVRQLHWWNDGSLAAVAVSLQASARETSGHVSVCCNTCVDRFFNNSTWPLWLSYISNIYDLIKKQILVFQQNLFASQTFVCIALFLGLMILKMRYEVILAETWFVPLYRLFLKYLFIHQMSAAKTHNGSACCFGLLSLRSPIPQSLTGTHVYKNTRHHTNYALLLMVSAERTDICFRGGK